MIHWLKTDSYHFARIWEGSKTYEVRKDDRNYEEGDILMLAEGTDVVARTNRVVIAEVTHRFGDNQPGVETGFATLGFRILGTVDGADEQSLQLYEYSKTSLTSDQWTNRRKRTEEERSRTF